MELEYGPEYELFRSEVRQFLVENWTKPVADGAIVEAASFRRQATAKGYLYRGVPQRYGGSEQPADPLKARVIREEFTRARAPREIEGPGVSMLVPTLLAVGEDWQKDRFVAKTLAGEYAWCQGYSEPHAGSDLAALRTRGEIVDGTWRISGQKVWTTLAHRAQFMFALVRTEPDAPKHLGISYLLIDMNQPGVTVRPLRQMSGGREFNEVFLDDARTPADWIVGARGAGWQVSRTTLRHERDLVGGAGATEDAFRKLVELARDARCDGRPALESEDVRQALARIEGYVLAQRFTSYRQMSLELAGQDAGLSGLLNKLNGTEIGHSMANLAQELIGSYGLLTPAPKGERGPEKWIGQIMGSLGVAIAGGASNIQRNIIAERGLGLPREGGAQS